MAYFDKTEYGKYLSVQNVSGSGDPASAPEGGIYLFASGTAGNAKLYLQNEGSSSAVSLADGGTLQMAGDSGTDTVSMASDTLTFAGGEGLVSTVSDNNVSYAVDVSDFSTSMTGDLEDTDEFAISDGGTMKKVDFSVVRDAVFADVSGDATVAAGGALTIGAGAVEEGMLNDNVISGQDELAHADIADADEFLISDGGTLKRVGVDSLQNHYYGNVSGDATIADGGALTIANAAVEHAMLANDAVDGDNIADDSVNSEHIALGALDAEHYSSGSIQTGHLAADAVTAAKLADDAVVTANIVDANVTTAKLAADAVDGTKLADDAVNSEHIALGALDAEHYSSGSIQTGHLAADAVTAAKLADDAVVTANIVDANVTTAKIADAAVTAAKIATAVAGSGLAGGGGSALSLDLNELGDTPIAVGADSIVFVDATDNSSKKDTVADFVAAMAGSGLAASSGVLSADLSELSDASVASGDKFVFVDATDDSTKMESIDDMATFMAGDGLAASSGVLAVGVDDSTIELNSDALRVKADGIDSSHIALGALDAEHYSSGSIQNGHLAGSIANAKLSNSSVTVTAGDGLKDGGSVALGASVTLNIEPADFAGTGLEDDGSDNLRIAASAAGNGLSGGGGSALALDLNELSAAAVAVASDSIAIIDADDNSSKKESIADLMTAVAGNGLAASSGVLAVGVDDSSIELNSDALRVKAGGITSAMIADGAIVNDDVNASAAIEATKLNFNVDLGGNVQFGTQSDDTVAFAGPIKAGANTIADSGNNAAITLDGSGGMSTLGGFGGGSGISFSSGNGAQFATALTVNKSDGSMANDFKVFGDTAGAYFMYDASADKAIMHNGSDEIMQLGTTTGGYAIEVANLSGDAGKIKASAFVTYSDESLKEEVTAMDNALDAVMSLNGVEFTWKGSGERDFGFLAQEVKSVLPQAVSVGNDGIHGVDYSRLTSVLVEAVKAQQVQIEELKALLKK